MKVVYHIYACTIVQMNSITIIANGIVNKYRIKIDWIKGVIKFELSLDNDKDK